MTRPPITIRKALASDAPFLARTILLAGRAHVHRGIWEIVLGGSEDGCLDFLANIAITSKPHLFHYSCSFIAEDTQHSSIGSLGGYSPEKLGYQALQIAIAEVAAKLDMPRQDFADSQQRAAKILACLPQEIPGAWVIDSVATLPDHRRSGVADQLMQKVLEQGRDQGHVIAQVNMYIGNTAALNLYQKFGFQVVEEKRETYFEKQIGSPGMLSLTRRLD